MDSSTASAAAQAAGHDQQSGHVDLPKGDTEAPTSSKAALDSTAPAVRFASKVQEIDAPVPAGTPSVQIDEPLSPGIAENSEATPEQIQALTQSLRSSKLQEQRLKSFSFDPVSLPVSRYPSNETSPSATPQISNSPMGQPSPGLSSRGHELVSPPLTPAGTLPTDSLQKARKLSGETSFDSQAITPQASGQGTGTSSPRPSAQTQQSSESISQRTTAADDRDTSSHGKHRHGMFSIGPGGQSVPTSRESSPTRNAASQYYSRPFTPHNDENDPYAASKRPPQSRNSAHIDSRFVFSRKKKTGSPSSSTISLPRSDRGSEKRLSQLTLGSSDGLGHGHHGGSMADLKRFFKVGGHAKAKKSASPAPSKAGGLSPASTKGSTSVPFGDHDLTSKYGKIGRVLGSGAGGSVKLMKRNEDNTVFAVKEFRPRHSYETEKEYVKKLTAEFCVGSALHHGNIIETLDIISEKGKWYEVMEYAPFDLFAIVMTGKMSKAEVTCCFLQILSGVTYLHSSGLAHRDLKLDNVVVSASGIMKIIDFGSAHVFRYPFESELVLASGIVGSDPYLAPEVYDEKKYDPQAVDIWSLAIIFCCMSLRRFPWKVPRLSDNSYKLFAAEPTPGHDPTKLILPSKPAMEGPQTPNASANTQKDYFGEPDGKNGKTSHKADSSAPSTTTTVSTGGATEGANPEKKEVIRGPWRLLRLLPRESRHIIGRMLTVDPKKRAKMEEILDEPWVSNTVICRQENGLVISADDHTHVLEPPAPVAK
ncbi:kinase-like domain-containing protein [Microdochium trichocladiopsis]|uniref:non-specific serine/threonine protein kinase n=1 Tax=Microdochium trichocladiopsis TaxID=1682393 RepID=A0A9P8Y666_9PEZI|nr:kinase-like domain-containing protein [Microdochium trichocladiopsis]KAH7030895.1 kinase-like domain-containing protein [Microdochium trichocladiopsis]